jgi:solute carrier family 31 (copper transporter), member 1
MLLGMYYNGYILLAIFIGQTTGYIVFGRDTLRAGSEGDVASGSCC